LPLQFAAPRSVNAYLIALARGYCLVDCGTGLPPGWAALEYALAQASVSPDELALLVCTHLHADHAGLAAEIVDRTGCEFARGAGPESADHLLRDPATPRAQRRSLGLREGIPLEELDRWVDSDPADNLDYERVTPDRLLNEGDEIETSLGPWRVIPAPGHSPAQILLFNTERRLLIMADLAYEVGEPFFEYGHSPDPYAEHLASLDRALRLDPALAFPGHGRVVESPRRRLLAARAAALGSCERVRDALSEQPRSAYELALELLGDRDDPGEQQSMLSVVLCVGEHLEGRGRGRSEVDPDGVRRWRRR
jgi:glyoxylase-like metal-dependent hydrolase (beta-lactamase superfamily II)